MSYRTLKKSAQSLDSASARLRLSRRNERSNDLLTTRLRSELWILLNLGYSILADHCHHSLIGTSSFANRLCRSCPARERTLSSPVSYGYSTVQ